MAYMSDEYIADKQWWIKNGPRARKGPKLFSVAEISAATRTSPESVRRWIKLGRLPAHKQGLRRWSVKEADLNAFLQSQPELLARTVGG